MTADTKEDDILASKAFTLGLGLKLSMINCGFELG
jgi:hypothetical protein